MFKINWKRVFISGFIISIVMFSWAYAWTFASKECDSLNDQYIGIAGAVNCLVVYYLFHWKVWLYGVKEEPKTGGQTR